MSRQTKAARTQATVDGPMQVTISLTADEANRLREFAKTNEFENPRTAIRALIAAALADYPSWGLVHEERKAALYQFKVGLHERLEIFLHGLLGEIQDERALMEMNREHTS